MKKTYITGISAILFFIAACLVSTASAAGVPVKLHVEPNAIHIGATYNGIDIAVQGEVPDGRSFYISQIFGSLFKLIDLYKTGPHCAAIV